MDRLLRIPAFYLFIYLVILPNLFSTTEWFNILFVLWALMFVVWVMKLNERLYSLAGNPRHLKLIILQVSTLFSFTYLAVILLLTDGYEISSEKDNFAEYGNLTYLYISGTLFCVATFLYSLYFTTCCVAILENELGNKELDKTWFFIFLWVYPIGIWWTQPKINRILKNIPLQRESDIKKATH